MKKLLFLASAMLMAAAMSAEVKLPYIMSDGMVLQRLIQANIYGKATPGAKITVKPSWCKTKYAVTAAADSTWLVKVDTPDAGGPYSIKITDGKDTRTLSDVLIGEVWLCSGQSNMEMPMMGFFGQHVEGSNEVLAKAKPSTPLRMFLTDKRDGNWTNVFSATPNDDIWGCWYDNSPKNVRQASAVGYYFAKYLREMLEMPVAIIVSTKGGTMIEPWMSAESLAEFGDYDCAKVLQPGYEINQHLDPTVQYNGRLHPLRNFTIKGMIWYQGEGNVSNPERYARLMELFVQNDVRRLWNNPDMPFYFVEISPFNGGNPNHIESALVREAQLDAARRIPHTGIVSLLDVGHPTLIHPANKAPVGERLALLALHDTYGREGFGYASPRYESMELKDGKAIITVSGAYNGLYPMWEPLDEFEICGEDGIWHKAQAIVDGYLGCRIAVWCDDVPEPKHVRYAFRNCPAATVFSVDGLPLHPFRTDRD